MATKKPKCPKGTKPLKSPVRDANGKLRTCTLPKKTKLGRSRDRKKTSGEFHERRYRKTKRAKKKG